MKKIRTVVADDEPLARMRITKLLERFDDILLVSECKNGSEALNAIIDYQPELLFLDIQMPDLNGFEVLAKSNPKTLPFIIFVTAYDQYALKAFDVHAVDYLLKPFDDERFSKALDHAKKQIRTRQEAQLNKKIQQIIKEHANEDTLQIELKDRSRLLKINSSEIYYIESDGNYVRLYLKEKNYLHRQTLQSLDDQLTSFLRIHRSILVNPDFVKDIKYTGNNQYHFTMGNGKRLLSSRSNKDEILNFLDNRDL